MTESLPPDTIGAYRHMLPALDQLMLDPIIAERPAVHRVYWLLLKTLDVNEVRHVKAWTVAETLKLNKKTVFKALELLVDRGYLIEHDRTTNNIRQFTLAYSRSSIPKRTPPA